MKTKSINTRTAVSADVEALVPIINFAYRGGKATRGWTTEEGRIAGARVNAEELEALIQSKDKYVFVADIEDGLGKQLAGCVLLETSSTVGYIGMLSVDPDLQSGGVGGALMRHAEGEAKRQGIELIELCIVNNRPELQAWYERLGYSPTGETKPFPVGDDRWELLDSTVHFIVLNKKLS